MKYDEKTMDLDERTFELEKQIIDTRKYINMIKSDLEEDIHILENEIVKLKSSKEVAEKEQKSSRWKPKMGDCYFYINSCGDVTHDIWFDSDTDIWRYNNIPIFETEAECEQYKKFREDVKTRGYGFSEEESLQENLRRYFIVIDYESSTPFYIQDELRGTVDFNTIYFRTKEDAQYIIDTYPEELRKWRI